MRELHLTRSAEETRAVARSFAASLHEGAIVALAGELGAGKTEFMRGVTDYFGCSEQLSSPTFSLFNIYEGVLEGRPVSLHHFDLYRIETERELASIGFEEYLSAAFCSFVEWAERFPAYSDWFSATVALEETGAESRRIIINRKDP